MELELEVELEEEDALLLKTLHLVCAAQPRGNPQVEVDTTPMGTVVLIPCGGAICPNPVTGVWVIVQGQGREE